MNAARFFTRLIAFGLTLMLADGLGQALLADKLAVPAGGRLPENQETGFLQGAIDSVAQASHPRIVFLGSSPTYGVTIKDPANTYPAQFEQALETERKQKVSVHNLAAKGFLAADLSMILAATLASADAYVIQLNYHTFSPSLLAGTPIRHPDLPERLGVAVPATEAKLLGTRPTPALNWNASLRSSLRRHWWFYRERERLALLWLGKNPERWLYDTFFPKPKDMAAEPAGGAQAAAAQDEDTVEAKPFYELKPARQGYIVKRYAQNASFELAADNLEWHFVRRMLAQLKAAGKPAVFFIAPINAEALSFYEVMDWKQYTRNVAKIKASVEAEGFAFVDINRSGPLPEDLFADISHTLDAGGQAFGPRLWALSRDYLGSRLKEAAR